MPVYPSPKSLTLTPLVIVSLFFILGLIFGHFLQLNFILFIVCLGISSILARLSLHRKFWGKFFLLCTVFLTGTLSYINAESTPAHNLKNFLSGPYLSGWLKGRVSSQIEHTRVLHGRDRVTFILTGMAIENKGIWLPVSGRLKATLFGEESDFGFGDILILNGWIFKPKNTSKDKFDYQEYLERQGIYGLLRVKADSLRVIQRSRNPLKYIFRFKERLLRIINTTLPYPERAILAALILGERQEIPPKIKDSFMRTGTVHILAISGLHVGLVSYIFYLFLKILRIPGRLSYFILIFLLINYAILTAGRAPVVRATIMAGIYLGGRILWREGQILNSLGLASLVILVFNPRQLFDAGFQLSFLSVLAIITLTPRIEHLVYPASVVYRNRGRRFLISEYIRKYLMQSANISFCAWIGILPVVGYYFEVFTPVAILANLLIIPLSFLILAIGLVTLFSGLVSFSVAQIFSHANLLCIDLLIKISAFLEKIPLGAIHTKVFSFPIIFIYYFGLTVLFYLFAILNKKFLPMPEE